MQGFLFPAPIFVLACLLYWSSRENSQPTDSYSNRKYSIWGSRSLPGLDLPSIMEKWQQQRFKVSCVWMAGLMWGLLLLMAASTWQASCEALPCRETFCCYTTPCGWFRNRNLLHVTGQGWGTGPKWWARSWFSQLLMGQIWQVGEANHL